MDPVLARAALGGGTNELSGEDSGKRTTSATCMVVRWANWAAIRSFALPFAPRGGDSRGAVGAPLLVFVEIGMAQKCVSAHLRSVWQQKHGVIHRYTKDAILKELFSPALLRICVSVC